MWNLSVWITCIWFVLGVVKRILWFWKKGPNLCRLSQRQLREISDKLSSLSGKIPSEFARQPRTLEELERWKATEFRQFLLYTGPVILRKVLSKDIYTHFLALTVSISILLESDGTKRTPYLDYAESLLIYFVNKSKELYGEHFIVYNVHNLLHLTDDVRNFNCSLNESSAFPYENHLQSLKKLIRNAKNPIAQVTKRLVEKDLSSVLEYKTRSSFTYISTSPRNQCFFLKNETYAFVKEKRENGTYLCDIVRQTTSANFFTHPCDSNLLNIVFVPNHCRMSRWLLDKQEINKKCVCLSYEDGKVIIPMLHGVEKN